jgi:hypothetical protein
MADGIAADEEQRRVLAAILPPGTAVDQVIRKLECSKGRFLESRANRKSNAELKAERAKWLGRIKAWKEVRELEEPEWWERNTAVDASVPVSRHAAARLTIFEVRIIIGPPATLPRPRYFNLVSQAPSSGNVSSPSPKKPESSGRQQLRNFVAARLSC